MFRLNRGESSSISKMSSGVLGSLGNGRSPARTTGEMDHSKDPEREKEDWK